MVLIQVTVFCSFCVLVVVASTVWAFVAYILLMTMARAAQSRADARDLAAAGTGAAAEGRANTLTGPPDPSFTLYTRA